MQSDEVKVVKENSKEADKIGKQDKYVTSTESIESTKNNEESNEHDCVYYICGICGYAVCKTEMIRKMHMTTKHRYYSESLICYTMVSADETMEQHVNSNHNGI